MKQMPSRRDRKSVHTSRAVLSFVEWDLFTLPTFLITLNQRCSQKYHCARALEPNRPEFTSQRLSVAMKPPASLISLKSVSLLIYAMRAEYKNVSILP